MNQLSSSFRELLNLLFNNIARISIPTILGQLVKVLCVCFVIWFSLSHYREPVNELARTSLTLLTFSGTIICLYYSFSKVFNEDLLRGVWAALCGLAVLVAIKSFVGNTIDELIRHPEILAAMSAVCVASFIIQRVCANISKGSETSKEVAYGIPATRIVKHPTRQDRVVTAAHEAGHALVCAALNPYPINIQVEAKYFRDETNSLGSVSMEWEHLLVDKTFAEWDMLRFLAGSVGERSFTGRESLGAAGDTFQWRTIATAYLSCMSRGIFFQNPENRLELEHNEQMLMDLYSEQIALLETFFEINAQVHRNLTENLLEKRLMTGRELYVYFDEVQFPESFPRCTMPNINA
jgi:hypothetical protein